MNYPSSIAVIPDGNRRFAKQNNLPLELAYTKGFEKVGEAVKWIADTPIKTTTFWALSLENFMQRSKDEMSVLFKIMDAYLTKTLNSKDVRKNKVKVSFFGKKQILPTRTTGLMNELEEKTRHNNERELNFAVAYSGQDELAHASVQLAKDLKTGKIDETQAEQQFQNYLYNQTPIDLVIRTGNVKRLSGFLPFQVAYSELYFSDKMWPAFSRQDFQNALDYYANTERRFGK